MQNNQSPTTCGLLLRPGISFANFFALLLISFAVVQSLLMGTSLLSLLIQDHKYYHVPPDHLGDIYGSFALYVQLFALLSELTSGYIQDLLGRRAVVVASLFLQALSAALLPFGGAIYPGLFLLRIVQAVSVAWCLTTPLLPDYVTDASKGLAGGYYQIAAGLGSLVFSFGMLQMAQHVDMLFVCELQAGILLAIALYCLFYVKNRHKQQLLHSPSQSFITSSEIEPASRPTTCWQRFCSDLRQMCQYLSIQKCLFLVLAMGFVGRVHDTMFASILSLWISKYLYDNDTSKVSNHLMITLGVSNALSLIFSFILGRLFDRFRQKWLLPCVYILAGLPYLLLYFTSPLDSIYAFFLQIWGTTFGIQTNAISYMMLAHYSPQQGKGAIYGLYYCAAGLGVLGFSKLAGYIVDQSYNRVDFLIVAGLSAGVVALHCAFLVCGRKYFKSA